LIYNIDAIAVASAIDIFVILQLADAAAIQPEVDIKTYYSYTGVPRLVDLFLK
jgi:hypothetical protein